MNQRRITIATVLLAGAACLVGVATKAYSESDAAPGKKCECFSGDASCFFDGRRCPVSGGKCTCFKSPASQATEAKPCCSERHAARPCCDATAAQKKFCQSICPVKVGGAVCATQCQLTQGHSGKHFCVKLHDF